MSPEEMRRLAQKLRRRVHPPSPDQTLEVYAIATMLHATAESLDEMADEDES